MFDQNDFYNFIFAKDVIEFFKEAVTLASGRKSHWYINWRVVSNDAFLLDELSDYVISFAKDEKLNPDCFYGVPDGATKLGIITQFKWAQHHLKGNFSMPMGRKFPKKSGILDDKYFIGAPKGNIIILEDVTTTGNSLIKEIEKIVEIGGCKINGAIGLTDRLENADITGISKYSVKEALAQMEIPYFSMSNARELLPLACNKYNLSDEIIEVVEREYEQFGLDPIKLR